MSKRKTFKKVNLALPTIAAATQGHLEKPIRPLSTRVHFSSVVPTHRNSHDFGEWYGVGIDEITYACQEQVTRLLGKQDADVEQITIVNYCSGLDLFLEYSAFCSHVAGHELGLGHINREFIDGYLMFLAARHESVVTRKGYYYFAKAVLLALGRRGLIHVEDKGDDRTFPRNPYPDNDRATVGDVPYSPTERKAIAIALKKAVQPLFDQEAALSSKLLTAALLVTALYTGRNTTPLLEMSPTALVDHPKGDRALLLLHKRRGRRVYKATLRKDLPKGTAPDTAASAGDGVERMIKLIIERTENLRRDAPKEIKDRLWLFRTSNGTRTGKTKGSVIALGRSTLIQSAKALAEEFDLRDDHGDRLRITVRRLRTTFVNRVFQLLHGDLALTAIAAGNTPRVAGTNYLRPGQDAQKNWRFMGEVLVQELHSGSIGATEKTPSGRCSDPHDSNYASADGQICTSFLNCVRCRNYVVTADDLYRVYSLYWRLLRERDRVSRRRWRQQFAHVIRLIERDVIAAGLEKGIFKPKEVEAARLRARDDPHPFWRTDTLIEMLGTSV